MGTLVRNGLNTTQEWYVASLKHMSQAHACRQYFELEVYLILLMSLFN